MQYSLGIPMVSEVQVNGNGIYVRIIMERNPNEGSDNDVMKVKEKMGTKKVGLAMGNKDEGV